MARPISLALSFTLTLTLTLGLTACGTVQAPARALVYDFGPVPAFGFGTSPTSTSASASASASVPMSAPKPLGVAPALALAEVQAPPALDSTAVLYRLAYADAQQLQQLRPYAQARWSMVPAQLVGQRLRTALGQARPILDPAQGLLSGPDTLTLRLELLEFSQVFQSATASRGVVGVRATLSQSSPGGERFVAQWEVQTQQPSATPDAPGGVQALAAATDALAVQLDAWLQKVQSAPHLKARP